jgi:glutamine amidotransferase
VRVTIFDYGAGNLHSLTKAIAAAGAEPVVEADPFRLPAAEVLVLPGVGAFGPAASRLAPVRAELRAALGSGLPCLGICLGMQLLFDRSEEAAAGALGLGLIEGPVTRLAAERTPQIGWNEIEEVTDPAVEGSGLRQGYYAHRFAARPREAGVVRGWTRYEGDRFPAVVASGRTLGVQFHPEKSSRAGLALIAAFLERSRA